jgi:hypothetical protein
VDLFAVGTDKQMYHRYLDSKGVWQPKEFEPLSGSFSGLAPAVACFDASHGLGATVHVYAIGNDKQMYHKFLDSNGVWHPHKTADWDALGGVYNSAPAAVGVNNVVLRYFGVGTKNDMYQGSYGGSYNSIGGKFSTFPAAIAGGNCDASVRLLCNIYVFATGADNKVHYSSIPMEGTGAFSAWKSLGGPCSSAPAAGTTWSLADGSDTTIHIVALSLSPSGPPYNEVLHKSFSQSGATIVWQPSETGWESLGGAGSEFGATGFEIF